MKHSLTCNVPFYPLRGSVMKKVSGAKRVSKKIWCESVDRKKTQIEKNQIPHHEHTVAHLFLLLPVLGIRKRFGFVLGRSRFTFFLAILRSFVFFFLKFTIRFLCFLASSTATP